MQMPLVAALSVLFWSVAASGQPLVVERGWVRAMPPTQSMTAAYMTLRNAGVEPVIIESVSMTGVAEASMHETQRTQNGVTMQALGSLEIGPGEQRVLAPGGAHIMLMGVKPMPAAGEEVTLCLRTSVSEQCERLPVLRQAPQR